MSLKTVIYTANKKTHFFKETVAIVKDIQSSHFLAFQMAKRDLQAQYRQSVLGFLWTFIPIIVNSLVWIFLNSSGAVNVNAPSEIPYSLYVIVGTTIWTMFVQGLTGPINSVNAGRSIISKINFPKEALIMGGVYKLCFYLAMQIVVLVIFLMIYKISPTAELLYFPLYLIAILIFGMAVGVLLAPIGLLYTDVGQLITIGAQFLMYVTPVAYMLPKEGKWKFLFEINPLTYLINDARNSLLAMPVENIGFTLILLGCSVVALVFGLVILRKSMNIIIEKIS